MSLTVTILGCGSSGGVPRVGNDWGACDRANPRNRRRRCSILLRKAGPDGETTVLVDTSPDLREQLLDTGIARLDGIVYTHDHADHTHGIDDIRPLVLSMRSRLAGFMDDATERSLRKRFDYIFESPEGSDYPPLMRVEPIRPAVPFDISGSGGVIRITPFRLIHGSMDALGLRVGSVAYTPDVSAIPPESLAHVQGLDLWIIDALRRKSHPSHFNLAEALDWVARAKPRHAVLTNLHTDLDYAALVLEVPSGVEPAYDGMVLPFGQ
jgi:phosphoribosyl 1,2-cyclic phosphate phosphodiesterase